MLHWEWFQRSEIEHMNLSDTGSRTEVAEKSVLQLGKTYDQGRVPRGRCHIKSKGWVLLTLHCLPVLPYHGVGFLISRLCRFFSHHVRESLWFQLLHAWRTDIMDLSHHSQSFLVTASSWFSRVMVKRFADHSKPGVFRRLYTNS